MNDAGVFDTFLNTFTSYVDSGFGLIKGEVTGLAACRAGFMRLPAWMTLPITTLPMNAGSSPQRRRVSRTAMAPSPVAGVPFSVPL